MLNVSFSGDFNRKEDAEAAIQLFLSQVREGYKSAPLLEDEDGNSFSWTEDEDGNSFSWTIDGEELSEFELFSKLIYSYIEYDKIYKLCKSNGQYDNPKDFLEQYLKEDIDSLYKDFEIAGEAIQYLLNK